MAVSPAPRKQSISILWLAGFLCVLLSLTWFIQWSLATEKLDRLLHDNWVRITQRTPPDEVVIAAIDPASLRLMGRWPWSRESQAMLFRQLARYQVKAAVIDMLFVEPDDDPDVDRQLADAMAKLPVVVLPILTESRAGQDAREKLPLPLLSRQVDALGHIQMPIDNDGIVRRLYLKGGFNQPHWSTLSLAAYNQIAGNRPFASDDELPGNRVARSGIQNRWEQDHEVLIPFYGPRGTIANVSAASIISQQTPEAFLKDKVVFIGLTSTGLSDVVPTPVSALDQPIPGVEIHANVYSALVDGSLVKRLDVRWNLLLALILLPIMLLVYSRARPQWGLLIAVIGALIPALISFALYRYAHYWFAPLTSSITVFISYIAWSWNRLSFLNRFVENETAMLAPLSSDSAVDNQLLVRFFQSARRHLPIGGWQFSAHGQVFSAGDALSKHMDLTLGDQWTLTGNVLHRRYLTPGKLSVRLMLQDPSAAADIGHYIDSLSQIRDRFKPSKFSGSIERLQINTVRFSDQVAWLRSLKALSESILEGSPSGFMVWNAAGELVRGNALTFDLLPHIQQSVSLADFITGVSSRSDAELHKTLRELIIDGGEWQTSYEDGEREYIINYNTVGESLQDRLVCAIVVDVTAIRTAERARSEMVDYLSHDLRSPLISALYLLDDNNEAGSDESKRVQANIKSSLAMMDDLLNIARADSLSPNTFDDVLFNGVLDNAIDQLTPQARSRGISISVSDYSDDFWLDGDASSLQRAVVNIIGNAIKYSSDNGSIDVQLIKSGTDLQLLVCDQGAGIDPSMLDDVFTRFKRDARVAEQFKGTGLGLALVARVVKQHGGRVQAQSPGKGTLITMTLPLKPEL